MMPVARRPGIIALGRERVPQSQALRLYLLPREMRMLAYPPVEDHGLIGDLQTAALVSTDGTVDWFCAPRFDSPSIFAALLYPQSGGHISLRPDGTDYVARQLYLPGTPILITRFLSTDGVGEVIELMPVTDPVATDRHRLARVLRVVRGTMSFVGECVPRGRESG